MSSSSNRTPVIHAISKSRTKRLHTDRKTADQALWEDLVVVAEDEISVA